MRSRVTWTLVAAVACGPLLSCSDKPRRFHFFGARGSLELLVQFADDAADHEPIEVFVDGRSRGHLREDWPILDLWEGEHEIALRCPGYRTYTKTMFVAREPNQTMLHVRLVPGEDEPPEQDEPAEEASEGTRPGGKADG